MFGSMPLFATPLPPTTPPKDVPPPTPVNFPRYCPEVSGNAPGNTSAPSAGASGVSGQQQQQRRKLPLTALLQSIIRPTEISLKHFEALGVRIQQDAGPTTVIPDYHNLVPDFATWDDIPYDDARDLNESTRRPISNGNRSPGIQTYLDRKRELSIDNNAAYRSVRRMQPLQPGQPPVRLGNAYEFFRHLENFSAFWDDTSMTPSPGKESTKPSSPSSAAADALETSKADGRDDNGGDGDGGDGNESGCDSVSSASSTAVTTDSESKPSSPAKDGASSVPEVRFFRTNAGSQMPPEFRLNIITAFLKLVAYDFGCNVSAPRMEPRLYLNAGTVPADEAQDQPQEDEQGQSTSPPKQPKSPTSYFSSGCIFVFRSPTTREAARAGIVEGPLAAVSARHTTTFPGPEEFASLPNFESDKDSSIDLARELVAALLTAQHRAREGRAERRIGKGEWWATKPRWGGGSGGPIGREVDAAPNTDEAVDSNKAEGAVGGGGRGSGGGVGSSMSALGDGGPPRPGNFSGGGERGGAVAGGGNPRGFSGLNSLAGITGMPVRGAAKKPRKGLAIYDNYRMVRPPSSSWDKKTRYMAIGRTPGADYDDIFVVSALFHHMSIVRVRVPLRLLQALDGEEEGENTEEEKLAGWAGLEVVRSRWYDFFKVDDRLAAMRLAWAMMAFLMRKEEEGHKRVGDVTMRDAT